MARNMWPSDQRELWNLRVSLIFEQWNAFFNYTGLSWIINIFSIDIRNA